MTKKKGRYSYLSAINSELLSAFNRFNIHYHSTYTHENAGEFQLINPSKPQKGMIIIGSLYDAFIDFIFCAIDLNTIKDLAKNFPRLAEEPRIEKILDSAFYLKDFIGQVEHVKINPLVNEFINFCTRRPRISGDMTLLEFRKKFMHYLRKETRKESKNKINEFYFSVEKNICSCVNYINSLVKIHGDLRVVTMRLGIIPHVNVDNNVNQSDKANDHNDHNDHNDPLKHIPSSLYKENDMNHILSLKDDIIKRIFREPILENIVGYIVKLDHTQYIGYHLHFISFFRTDIGNEISLPLLIYKFWHDKITENRGYSWGYEFKKERSLFGDEIYICPDINLGQSELTSFIRQIFLRDKLVKIITCNRRTLDRGVIKNSIENKILISNKNRNAIRAIFNQAKADNVAIESLIDYLSKS